MTVLKQCGFTMLGIKAVIDFQLERGGVDDAIAERRVQSGGQGRGGGVTAEIFVSSVEACARPLERGKEGMKLVVRVEQVR